MDDLFDLPPGIDVPRAALPRCWPDVDAMKTDGERRGAVEICIDWANGRCARGVHCAVRHAKPQQADENRLTFSADGVLRDIFGRPRPPASAASPLTAFDPLACSIIHVTSGIPEGSQAERRRWVDEAFGEWGAVVKTWFVADEGSCFVKFKWRSTAQLVLEACHGRPLRPEDNEPLQLKWCSVEPSAVQAQQGREMAYSAMREARERAATTQALYASLEREKDGIKAGRGARVVKRPREEEPEDAVADFLEGGGQTISAVAASYPGGITSLEDEQQAGGSVPAAETPSGESAEAELPAGWHATVDPTYGVAYYFNEATGASQWHHPSAAS